MSRSRSISLLALLIVGVLAAPANAARSYCSPSGDVCYSANYRNGDVSLSIGLTAKYFSSYRLCVTPDGYAAGRECKRFTIRATSAGAYGSAVRWSRHFTSQGGGRYHVNWYAGGNKLGPRLTFMR